MTELTNHEQSILNFLLSPDIKNIALGLEFMKKRSLKRRRLILEEFILKHIGNAGPMFNLAMCSKGDKIIGQPTRVNKYKAYLGARYFTYQSKYASTIDFWTVERRVIVKPFFPDLESKEETYEEGYYFQYEVKNNGEEYHVFRGEKAWNRLFLALQDLVNHIIQRDD